VSGVNQRIACKAVIAKDGKVLVLREASTYDEGTATGRYTCPGGRIDPGEPFLDALKREIFEETGLDVKVGDPVYVGEWFPVIKGTQNQIVAIFFVCTPLSNKVRLSEEHDDYQWVTRAEAKALDLIPPYDSVIEKYFKNLTTTA
jgi:8-oxo-dGTP diphosphatase